MDLNTPSGKKAYSIAKRLHDQGDIAVFAGGCVRDFLMNVPPKDFDIATTATPEKIEKLFSKTIPVGKQFGVMLVVEDGENFEVATFRREGGYVDGRHPGNVSFTIPEEDAKRRDFTVNGLFYDPFEKKVLDYVDGKRDLERKQIRAIGDPNQRFEEDKLRLLRAVRFAAGLGFEIEAATWEAVKRRAAEITAVSPERIRDEIVKIISRPGAPRGIKLLSESGLLKAILPEIEAMKGVAQQPDHHPEGDVFVHTCLLLEKIQHPTPELALSALFHDVAKPVTYAVRDGRITFYEHAPIGAKMTETIMRRLKFSNQEIEKVTESVANHMKFADVQKMRSGKLKLFVSRPNFDLEMELHKIDCMASHGMLDNYHFLKKKMEEYAKEELRPDPFITGHDLISLGMKPGPGMKPLLEEIYTLQLENRFANKDEALAWTRARLSKEGTS